MYRGRILQDDIAISSISFDSENAVHIVIPASQPETDRKSPLDKKLPQLDSIMSNPIIDSLLSNPDFFSTILQSDSRFQKMAEQNPEIKEALSDPAFLRGLSKAASNPKIMQEMMRNQGLCT